MPEPLAVPSAARTEAVCRIAASIERTMRDLTDVCPWPQRAACPLDLVDAGGLARDAFLHLLTGGACA